MSPPSGSPWTPAPGYAPRSPVYVYQHNNGDWTCRDDTMRGTGAYTSRFPEWWP
jgi:hypothetical protein